MKNGSRRLIIAFAVSLLLHALLFAPIARRLLIMPAPIIPNTPVALNFNLHPPKPPTSYTEAVHPTDEQTAPTDLIAEENSKAADTSNVLGERLAPFFQEPSQNDQVAGPPTPLSPPQQPQPTPPTEQKADAPKPEQISESKQETPNDLPQKKPSKVKKDKSPGKEVKKANPDEPDSTRMKLAQNNTTNDNASKESDSVKTTADSATENNAAKNSDDSGSISAPQTPPSPGGGGEGVTPGLSPGQAKGRVDGGVLNEGFLGFEAMKSEVAPYLKLVRTSVERKWFSAMAFRYQGVTPTKAVVDCAISPDGKLVNVEIRDEGAVPLFAKISKDAIDSAAPFPPFPFKVPDMYSNKNLEIRWTFNFMK